MNSLNQFEQRLMQFSVDTINLCKTANATFASQHLMKELIRSSTSAALNYEEARSGESSKYFIHKIKLSLKELKESHVDLRMQQGADLGITKNLKDISMKENDKLISIFVSSIQTASNKYK